MKNIKQYTLAIILSLGLVLGVSSLQAAWTTPTGSPPNGNVDAPINTGLNYQAKLGQLLINTDPGHTYSIGLSVFGKALFNDGVQITSGTPADGKVLTSDASGNASWVMPSTSSVDDTTLTYTIPDGQCKSLNLHEMCYDKDGCTFMMITGNTPQISGHIVSDNAFSDTESNPSSTAWYTRFPNQWGSTFVTGDGSNTTLDYAGYAYTMSTLPLAGCTDPAAKYRLFMKSSGYTNKIIFRD